MIKKMTKHGNSLALVINKPVLEPLKIDAETPLEVSTDGRMLMISPVRDAKCRKAFEQALAKTNRRYGRMLERLAE